MFNFKEWWQKNRDRILRQRRAKYRQNAEYRRKIQEKMRMRRKIERFLKPYIGGAV